MPSATTRLSLTKPLSTDATTEYRTAITNNATELDEAVLITEGVLSARPTTGLVYGQTYLATDNGLLYFYNGTVWEIVLLAGAWVNLTSYGTNVTTGFAQPRYRTEGDTIRVTGAVELTGTLANNAVLVNLPTAAQSAGEIIFTGGTVQGSAIPLMIDTSVIRTVVGQSSGVTICLDHTYPLS